MEKTYTLNELSMMTGFTTRTLRNYLIQGLLHGEKENGVWQFSAGDLDRFFNEPYVKEGLRIKRSGTVFDFLADSAKKTKRSCVILDLPASREEGAALSAFFCSQMERVSDTLFSFDWSKGFCRVILSGAEDQVAKIMQSYYARETEA